MWMRHYLSAVSRSTLGTDEGRRTKEKALSTSFYLLFLKVCAALIHNSATGTHGCLALQIHRHGTAHPGTSASAVINGVGGMGVPLPSRYSLFSRSFPETNGVKKASAAS